MSQTLSGLIAAPFTPFNPDKSLNLAQIEPQAAWLHANGVSGAFICGTTGEGTSLTVAERLKIAAEWSRKKPRELALVVHVGHLSLHDSIELARHAAKIKADAIATIAPSFFKPASMAHLIHWCAEIANAAPRTPFYYYHMPAMTGVDFSMADFLAQAGPKIPTLAGVKFTHENLMDFGRSVAVEKGRYNILFGRDEILLAGYSMGATGAVGSTYNSMAPLYNKMIAAFEQGDLSTAQKLQLKAIEAIVIINRYGGLPANKAIMKLTGLDMGPVRAPLHSLSREQTAKLQADLKAVGFFDYCSRRPSKKPRRK